MCMQYETTEKEPYLCSTGNPVLGGRLTNPSRTSTFYANTLSTLGC